MTKVDWAWIAGILEGEGHFRLLKPDPRNKTGYRQARIELKMTDEDIIARFSEKVGLNSYSYYDDPRPNRQRIYRATVSGPRAEWVMTNIYPLMGERRQQAITDILLPVLKYRLKKDFEALTN